MSDKTKNPENKVTEEEVCEVIELAIEDIETLTAAFSLISDLCEDTEEPALNLSDEYEEVIIH